MPSNVQRFPFQGSLGSCSFELKVSTDKFCLKSEHTYYEGFNRFDSTRMGRESKIARDHDCNLC
jgi:hypothetical protein